MTESERERENGNKRKKVSAKITAVVIKVGVSVLVCEKSLSVERAPPKHLIHNTTIAVHVFVG